MTHLHAGDEPTRLAPLRKLIDEFQMDPAWVYPTDVERHEALIDPDPARP